MEKPIIVYFNPDCFLDTDITVLHYLTNDFHVVWFYLYESHKAKEMRYNPEIAKEYADKYGITLEIVDQKMRRRNLKNLFLYRKVANLINSYNPDIVYSSCIFPFWTLCNNKIECKNKVLGIHDVSLHSYKFSLAKHWTQYNKERWIRRFENIFTFSINQHNLLKEKFHKESSMVGMSYKYFGNSNLEPQPIQQGVKILFFGRIDKYKGLDLLIQTLEELKLQGVKNLNLTIAGKGNSWEDCKGLIKSPELYNLKIRFIDNSEIPDLMSSHHFLVLPYRNATQSGPLVTALGYNIPVIAPDFGCFSDTLNNEASVLYQQGNLIEALRIVSKMDEVDYLRKRNAMNSLRENYSEEKIANNYILAYKKILNEGKR